MASKNALDEDEREQRYAQRRCEGQTQRRKGRGWRHGEGERLPSDTARTETVEHGRWASSAGWQKEAPRDPTLARARDADGARRRGGRALDVATPENVQEACAPLAEARQAGVAHTKRSACRLGNREELQTGIEDAQERAPLNVHLSGKSGSGKDCRRGSPEMTRMVDTATAKGAGTQKRAARLPLYSLSEAPRRRTGCTARAGRGKKK
ncbi:hypothetical protein ERJ75_000267500 [Trypanosoma vivax]|nr:hypothetical protein ERJ75_000267500 [Trypanosoma vivax]